MTTTRPSLRTAIVALMTASTAPVYAVSLYVVPDVPTDLGGATFPPWEVVRNDAGAYATALVLPDATAIDAVHRMDDGDWLLSVESAVVLDGTLYEPRDVIRYDGANYTMYLDGSAAGIPAGSNVDAALLDGGALIVSFDVPTTIGGVTYEPADLVGWDGVSFGVYFDASATTPPIPPSTDVIGADRRGSLIVLAFDVPTTLGGQTFLPGEIISWDGTSFASFYQDPSWPSGSRADALALLAHPGIVATIHVTKSALVPGDLTISWSSSCSAGAEDYAIYEGAIGSWYSHQRVDCSDDGGDLTEEITPAPGGRYYLVVPLNVNDEGSYGRAPDGTERPAGAPACLPSQALASCP